MNFNFDILKISEHFKISDFKLCYIDDHRAYFTTQPVTEQWGDDWNDAPYEHNAGEPYTPTMFYKTTGVEKDPRDWNEDGTPKYEIKCFFFSGDLSAPCEDFSNSPYSVEQINAGHVPWLRSTEWNTSKINIMAGTTLPEFVNAIEFAGGDVFIPLKMIKEKELEELA